MVNAALYYAAHGMSFVSAWKWANVFGPGLAPYATGDAGNDAEAVVFLKRRVQPVEKADVVLAQKDVHKVPKLVTVVQVLLYVGIAADEVVERLTHVAPVYFNLRLISRVGAKRRRNLDTWHRSAISSCDNLRSRRATASGTILTGLRCGFPPRGDQSLPLLV